MKESSRRWIFASVVAALILGLTFTNIDENKIYNALKNQLAQTGVLFNAKSLTLSPMYMGSINLNDVNIQTHAFTLHAEQISIDLNLAALLTGKALPQALYIRFADINILNTEKSTWLNLMKSESFKLKRIDISQSEIHFEQQHLTLEQTNLDIRDIGKNKNPRAELRAHIGDGRIDAHGYLHLKHGKITRGFSRIKLVAIPLSFIQHETTLETLTGSITAHMYQDKPWQTFGHLALQKDKRNYLELRGKLKENETKLFVIDDMVLQVKDAGSIQISGACDSFDTCHIKSQSSSLKLEPIVKLLKNKTYARLIQTNNLKNINLESDWQAGSFTSQGHFFWKKLHYNLNTPLPEQKDVHLGAGSITFKGLHFSAEQYWSLESASLIAANDKHANINITSVEFQPKHWKIPLHFQNSDLWLPIAQVILDGQQDNPSKDTGNIAGAGNLDGHITLQHQQQQGYQVSFDLDASQSAITWQGYTKPQNIPLTLQGQLSWQNNWFHADNIQTSIHLADAYANIDYNPSMLTLEQVSIDLDQLKTQGILLPEPIHAWQGSVMGDIRLKPKEKVLLYSKIKLQHLGTKNQTFTGEVNFKENKWKIPQLFWQFGKNTVQFTSNRYGQVNANANYLDSDALETILHTPFAASGKLTVKNFALPFGTLKDVSTAYNLNNQNLTLKKFKGIFYEGTLRSKNVELSIQNQQLHITTNMQAGGVRLNSWLWLHKQFDTHLEGRIYATLNLDSYFDKSGELSHWQGDGDIMVYNAKWLLNNKRIQADKLALSIRKRENMTAIFDIAAHKKKGKGNLHIDADANITGLLHWQGDTFILSKTWPHLYYEQQ